MPLDFLSTATCDRCSHKTHARIVVTKLKPHPEMHLSLPAGWQVSSMPESEELLITCPKCPPTLVSIPPPPPVPIAESLPPIPISESELFQDPATDPTMRPPPPKKES